MKKFAHVRKYSCLIDFYNQLSNYINNPGYDQLSTDPEFTGLPKDEIEKSKFGYSKGLEILDQLPDVDYFAGSTIAYKYSETDGDDLNIDRFLDGMPALRQRTRVNGLNTGRFVDIYINIGENCNVGFEDMLFKTYATVKIADQLESKGIRCNIKIAVSSNIHYKSGKRAVDYTEIQIKDYNETLNIALLCNVTSPWFFRRFIFQELTGKYLTETGIASSIELTNYFSQTKQLPDCNNAIIIDNGQCLSFESATKFINNLNLN